MDNLTLGYDRLTKAQSINVASSFLFTSSLRTKKKIIIFCIKQILETCFFHSFGLFLFLVYQKIEKLNEQRK